MLDILNSNLNNTDAVQLRNKNNKNNPGVNLTGGSANRRPVSIHDRLSQLETAQGSWQNRVGEKDNKRFTVAAKMEKEKILSDLPMLSPETAGNRIRPMTPTKESSSDSDDVQLRVKMTPKPRTITGEAVTLKTTQETSSSTATESNVEKLVESEGRVISVPNQIDEKFEQFFMSSSLTNTSETSEAFDDFDLDLITSKHSMLSVPKRASLQPNRRRSKNPLKALKENKSLVVVEEYQERSTNVVKLEEHRIKTEKANKGDEC